MAVSILAASPHISHGSGESGVESSGLLQDDQNNSTVWLGPPPAVHRVGYIDVVTETDCAGAHIQGRKL